VIAAKKETFIFKFKIKVSFLFYLRNYVFNQTSKAYMINKGALCQIVCCRTELVLWGARNVYQKNLHKKT